MTFRTLLAVIGIVALSSCSPERGDPGEGEKGIELGVRSLLRAIGSHDIPKVLSFVGPGGVTDANQVVARDQIAGDLKDEGSYLYKSLFAEPTPDEIATCVEKLKGTLYVSPSAFVNAYGDDFTVKVDRMDEFTGEHYGVKVESTREAQPGCQYELYWLRMHVVDGKVLLASNFFQ